jgi:hypothetical protein
MIIFQCKECGLPISVPLEELKDEGLLCLEDGKPLLPRGKFFHWPKDAGHVSADHYEFNVDDLTNVKDHTEPGRWNGCCGPDGLDGPNQLCLNGHEVGAKCADCWMPHSFSIPPELVHVKST